VIAGSNDAGCAPSTTSRIRRIASLPAAKSLPSTFDRIATTTVLPSFDW
jgi:hypothetical protein